MKITYLPLDDRPCLTDSPKYLAQIAGIELELVETDQEFRESALHSDAMILSLDRWVYGGLVKSRVLEILLDKAEKRISELEGVLDSCRSPVYAYSVLMRQAPSAFSEEEAVLADKIKRASIHYDDSKKFSEIIQGIPSKIWDLYLETRKRNFKINQKALLLTAENKIQFLVFAMDDLIEQGLNQKEKRILEKKILQEKLQERSMIIPGADETGFLLLTKTVLKSAKLSPAVFPFYSHPDSNQFLLEYEDCRLSELVDLQLKLIGGRLVNKREDADLLLFIHSPQENQKDVPIDPVLGSSSQWIDELRSSLSKGLPCILADLRYANGADPLLMRELSYKIDFSKLLSFSAWNTAANALGIALSHGILRWSFLQRKQDSDSSKEESFSKSDENKAHFEFLYLRFLEDWFYQSEIRPALSLKLKSEKHSVMNLAPRIKSRCENEAAQKLNDLSWQYLKSFPCKRGIKSVSFPWNRLFDIQIHLQKDFRREK